jgi:hypothetical protein
MTPAAEPPVRDSGPVEGAPGEPGGSPVEEPAAEIPTEGTSKDEESK